jgi:phosphoglycerate kinase
MRNSLNRYHPEAGGDNIAFFDKYNLMDKFTFVSTGGGAMLKLLSSGTLPTIEALG